MSSRITRLLFFWNFVALAILAGGALLLSEMRAGLIKATIESLSTQGQLLASVLADTATVGEPEPQLREPEARETLRRLRIPETLRVRLFHPDGELVADTDLLFDRVEVGRVPQGPSQPALLPFGPAYTLDEEIARAAKGDVQRGQRIGDQNQRVVSVSLPVSHVQAVLGVLTIESRGVDHIIAAERFAMLPFIASAAVVLLLSSSLLALLIARPLRALSVAADRLRLGFAKGLELPHDVLRRKDEIGDLAQALARMTNALLERIDANDRFAADVSHEIKNPLTSIRSAVETARSVDDPATRARLLSIIAADVGRLDRLITDISRASRIEAETARGEAKPVDLAKLLTDLAETYNLTRGDNEPRVAFRLAGGRVRMTEGQEGPLFQVFRNLLDNARSFGPPDSEVTLTLAAAQYAGEDVLRVSVEDAGPGVPPENLETVFQRFYTQRPKGAAFGGNSGLGLSIARQIVETHKGRIWAENRKDENGAICGARFIVELPALRDKGPG